jgi:hypothetical protein
VSLKAAAFWYSYDRDNGWPHWRACLRFLFLLISFRREFYMLPPWAREDPRPWYSVPKLLGLKEKPNAISGDDRDDRTRHGLGSPEA